MTRYVYLGSNDDVIFFFLNWQNLSMFALKFLKNIILDFFKTSPIKKSKIFGTIKCILWSGTPT